MPSKTNNKQETRGSDAKMQVKSKEGSEVAKKSTESGNGEQQGKRSMKDAQSCIEHWEDDEHLAQNQEEYKKFQEQNRRSAQTYDDDSVEEGGAKKRGRGANASTSTTNKRQKSSGGRHDEPKGAAGDKTRVPVRGQKAQWKAPSGYADGKVVEVVYEEKTVEGNKHVKASKEDPEVVLKSDSSGKICVQKAEAVHFE